LEQSYEHLLRNIVCPVYISDQPEGMVFYQVAIPENQLLKGKLIP
jgi:hypothetical protein